MICSPDTEFLCMTSKRNQVELNLDNLVVFISVPPFNSIVVEICRPKQFGRFCGSAVEHHHVEKKFGLPRL